MRGYDRVELYGNLLELLESKGGMTGSAISNALGISRITISKYLGDFESDGMLCSKTVGNSTMWYAVPNAVRFEFPSDYANAARLYSEAISSLSEAQALYVLGSCMNCGASAVSVLSEVLTPAIEMVQKMYDSGKIGSAEKSLMHNIILRSMFQMKNTGGNLDSNRHVILVAADPQSALYAETVASVLHYNGWRVMRLGDMSNSVGVLFDTELKKLLVRVRASEQGITVIIVFSGTPNGLRTLGAAASAARKGAASGTLLGLCGPKGHGINADANVTSATDIVHWVESL